MSASRILPVVDRPRLAQLALGAGMLLLPALAAEAQGRPIGAEVFAGSAIEDYLRTLQALGSAPIHPWSLRGFSPSEIDRLVPRDSAHAWAHRYDFGAWSGVVLVRPTVGVRYNSTFPFGSNDGAVWAGRGLTVAAEGGAAFRWGALSGSFIPVAFWTQNSAFALTDNGQTGKLEYADVNYATIDRPQRFGDGSYARLDLGHSALRVEAGGASVGVSNAHQWWGPAAHYPFILGNNAPGFPHLFVGTARPANIWLARLHGRVLWGKLDQSDYFDPPPGIGRPRRFVTGLALVLQPRGLENLEIGAARFIHAPWPDEGMPGRYLTRAFEGIFKLSLPAVSEPIPGDERSSDGENQIASVFARLTLSGSGFELYGEFGREDHPWDKRALVLHPDEQASLMVGVRRSWRRSAREIVTVRAEAINFQQSSIDQERGGSVIYLHAMGSNQGHTQRGQLLGAAVGSGSAAGNTVGVDLLSPDGAWSVEWTRTVRQQRPGFAPDGGAARQALDVLHALTMERVLFRGGAELTAAATGAHNFNRNFAGDQSGVSLLLSIKGLPR